MEDARAGPLRERADRGRVAKEAQAGHRRHAGTPRCDSEGAPRFIVLVLGEGELDDSTEGVFADSAEAVADALRELGVSRVSVVYCADARLCKAPRDAPFFTVVLGAHHLARYRFDDHGVSKTLCETQGWPDPDSSVLYNFETVNEQILLKTSSRGGRSRSTSGTTRRRRC